MLFELQYRMDYSPLKQALKNSGWKDQEESWQQKPIKIPIYLDVKF